MTGKNQEQSAFEERMRLQIEAYHEAALVYAAVKLGLPDRMGSAPGRPSNWPAILARHHRISSASCAGSSTLGICTELPDGTFRAAPGGWSLRSDSHSRLDKKVQIVVEQYWRPWADLVSCLKTGEPAFDQIFGMSVWDWRREHAEQGVDVRILPDRRDIRSGRTDHRESFESAAEAASVGRYRRRLRRRSSPLF